MSATIYDVARLAGVSISTVSRVLNGSGYASDRTREKVMEAVRQLDFQKSVVASALISKHTSSFGLIVPDIRNVFYAELTRAIEDTASSLGFSAILCNTDNDAGKEQKYIGYLLRKSIDGILFASPVTTNENIKLVSRAGHGLPVVLINSRVGGAEAHEILVDNEEGGYIATRHLLEKGHRRIGIVLGFRRSFATGGRLEGYRRAHREYGVRAERELVLFSDFTIEGGYRQAARLLARENRPTAVFVASDYMAVGVYRAAREAGLEIPEDLSVVGFDDTEYARILSPQLTTVRSPVREMGGRAVEVAVKALRKGRAARQTVTLRPSLVERDSAQKPRG